MSHLSDSERAELFDKAQLCNDPDCNLCVEALPYIEELIRRHREQAWDEGQNSPFPDDYGVPSPNPYRKSEGPA